MPRFTLLGLVFWLFLSCVGYSQQPSSAQPSPAAQAPSAGNTSSTQAPANASSASSNVPMDQPVITLEGACKSGSGSTTPPPGCVKTLTREDFEKLTAAIQPPGKPSAPPDVKRNFASQYSKLLIFADAARELGLENDSKVQQIYRFAQNQILAEALNQYLINEYAHPPEQQVETYYKDNTRKFTEVTLQRVTIPRITGSGEKPKPSEAEEKAFVDKIRARWVAGEDPAKLQKEAMENAGQVNSLPEINVGPRRPGTLPEAHDPVFDLKPGEISQPFTDPAAFYIYKVISVRQVPLNEVKASIESTLQRQAIADKVQQIQSSVTPVLNDAYFGPEKPASSNPSANPKAATPDTKSAPSPEPRSAAPPK